MRKTKIICTIGPASESEEKLRELMLAGMNVARFNFSHGTHKEQLAKYNRVLKVREELQLPVATLLDTKGPEIRLRDFEGGKVELKAGQKFVLTTDEMMGTAERATISRKPLTVDNIRMGNFSRRKSHLQVLFNLLLSNNILKICHTSPSFLLFCLTSGENIQQKSLDFSYFIQNGKVVLLVLHQLLCKLIQIFINQPDNTVYSVPSPFIQKILSGKRMGPVNDLV
jgi:hypothetical protein